MRSVVYLIALACIATQNPQVAFGQTLTQALTIAYHTNPTLQAERSEVSARLEDFNQSQDAFGPTVNAYLSSEYQSALVDQRSPFFGSSRPHLTARTNSSTVELRQPLFTGGRLAAAVEEARAAALSEEEALRGAEADLFKQVIEAYAAVIRDRESVQILEGSASTLELEQKAVDAKLSYGVATIADKAQIQARLALARSQLAQIRARLRSSEEVFQANVGTVAGQLTPPLSVPGVPPDVNAALMAGSLNSSAIKQAVQTERQARAHLESARAALRPQIAATISAGSQPLSQFERGTYDRNLSATISLQVPIFQSDKDKSLIRQAEFRVAGAVAKLELAKRLNKQDILSGWAALVGSREYLQQISDQKQLQMIAYKSLHQQFDAGLISTIDLLNAEQELVNVELNQAQAVHDELVQQSNLLAACGLLDGFTLLPEEQLQEAAGRRRDAWWTVGVLPIMEVVERIDKAGAAIKKPSYPVEQESAVTVDQARPEHRDTTAR